MQDGARKARWRSKNVKSHALIFFLQLMIHVRRVVLVSTALHCYYLANNFAKKCTKVGA